MHKFICPLIAHMIGFGLGSLATYVIMNRKFDRLLEKEIDGMIEYYENKDITYEELVEAGKIKETEEEPVIEKEDQNDILKKYTSAPSENSLIRGKPKKHIDIDYTKFNKVMEDPAENEHPRDDEYESLYHDGLRITKEAVNAKEPKLIKKEDFGSESHFNTMTLMYYTEDDILVLGEDQNEEELIDLDEEQTMLGNCLDKFGFRDNEEEIIYIRNYKRCCDYEIVKVFGSYYEAHP